MSQTERTGSDDADPQEGTLNGEPLKQPEVKEQPDTDQKEG